MNRLPINPLMGGMELYTLPFTRVAIVDFHGHRRRKKRRVYKKMVKRYGYKITHRRVIPAGRITMVGNMVIGHEPEIREIERQARGF